jgi:hypothetical protein
MSKSYKKISSTKKPKPKQWSNDDIKEALADYDVVEDVSVLSLGSHLRYIKHNDDGSQEFKPGGFLKKLDLEKKYMVLEGGNNVRWSVQIPKTVFFKKLSVPEIKEKYEKEIEKLKKENKKLKNTIKEIKQHFKN